MTTEESLCAQLNSLSLSSIDQNSIASLLVNVDMTIRCFIKQYKNNSDIEFRKKILTIILSNNQLIVKSKPIIYMIFRDYGLNLDLSKPNIDIQNELNKVNPLLSIIDTTNIKETYLTILSLFEIMIYQYIKTIQLNDFIQGNAFTIFKQCVGILDNLYQKSVTYPLTNICLFYSSAYLKVYLAKYVDEISKENNSINVQGINAEMASNKTPVRATIQLYIIQLLFYKIGSYDKLITFNFTSHHVDWMNDYITTYSEIPLFHLFFPLNDIQLFLQMHLIFSNFKCTRFANHSKELLSLFNTNKINIFVDNVINHILSKIVHPTYLTNKSYIALSSWYKSIINSVALNKTTIDLLSLFLDKCVFENKLYPKINAYTQSQLEIILHGYKLSILCSQSNPSSFYNQLLSQNANAIIQSSYIPGGEPNSFLLFNYKEVEQYSSSYPDIQNGLYICSCHKWYTVPPCGLPMQIKKCGKCGLDIGGPDHNMVKRDGHLRILNNRQQLDQFLNHYLGGHFCPYIFLDDYKKIIDGLVSKVNPGVNKDNLEYHFKEKEVRGLTQVSYRVLSFVFYSMIFFSNQMGYLSDVDVLKYVTARGNWTIFRQCFKMMETNWEALRGELQKNNIFNIDIFMNIIFEKIAPVVRDSNLFNTNELRIQFENNITQIINEEIKTFAVKGKNYQKYNSNLNALTKNFSLESIITKKTPTKLLSHNAFPFHIDFNISSYPNYSLYESDMKEIQSKIA